MNRRTFVVSTAASVAAATMNPALLQWGIARQATPHATPATDVSPSTVSDYVELGNVEVAVNRFAEILSPSFALFISGALFYVDAWGFQFAHLQSAQDAPVKMARGYKEGMTEVRGAPFGDLQEASSRRLGDEAWGWQAPIPDLENDVEFQWALFAVRKNTTLQILVGVMASGSPTELDATPHILVADRPSVLVPLSDAQYGTRQTLLRRL